MSRLLRSVSARELTFWQAFEEVEGPIGYGPLLKMAAWLGWTQCDGEKTSAGQVLELIEDFLADPHLDYRDVGTLYEHGDEDLIDDSDDGALDEDAEEERLKRLSMKIMHLFNHPELKNLKRKQDTED